MIEDLSISIDIHYWPPMLESNVALRLETDTRRPI